MKTTTLILALTFCWSMNAAAQGIHLLAGDAFSFGFNAVDGCHFTEGAPGAAVTLVFGNDTLGPGESVRLEMFENSLADQPFATQVYSPSVALPSVILQGPSSHWLDDQGIIRLTMGTGSLDVDYGHFFVSPNPNTYCDTYVIVPEPSASVLMALGGAFGAVGWAYNRRRWLKPLPGFPWLMNRVWSHFRGVFSRLHSSTSRYENDLFDLDVAGILEPSRRSAGDPPLSRRYFLFWVQFG